MTLPSGRLGRAALGGALLAGLTVHTAVADSPGDQASGAAVSGASQATPAVDALVPLLHDPDPQVRAGAVVALGRLAPEAAVDGLIVPMLDDADPEVSLAAARALIARAPPPDVVGAVAAHLQSPQPHTRIAVTEILRKLHAVQTIPDLLRAHDDATDARSRYRIAVALQALGVDTPVGPRRAQEIEEELARSFGARAVLVVGTRADNAEQGDDFALFGRKVASLLERQGLDPVPVTIRSASEFLELLRTLARRRLETDGLVIFGHGGYDGPIFSRDEPLTQIAPTNAPAQYAEMVRLLRTVVRRQGIVFVQACHSAGASELERDGEAEQPDGRREVDVEAQSGKNWARSLAERTPFYVVGVRGKTAVEPPPTLLEQILVGGAASPDLDVVGPWGRAVPAGFTWVRARAADMRRGAETPARRERERRTSIARR